MKRILIILIMATLILISWFVIPRGYQVQAPATHPVMESPGFERAMVFHGPDTWRRVNPENGSLEFWRDGEWCLLLTLGCQEWLRK